MSSYSKILQRFLVSFFALVSILVVVLGIQRTKQGENLGTTASPDNKGGAENNTITGTNSRVAGISQTINAKGDAYQTPWGDLVATIQVKDGQVVAVDIPQLPDSPPSVDAKAYLIDQALRSGGANIQGVSGATITSRAFKASLESAIAVALAQRGADTATGVTDSLVVTNTSEPFADTQTVPTPAVSKTNTTQTRVATNVGVGVSGTFTGNAYQTPWGNAVASVTFTNGKVTAVGMPQVPNSPPSVEAKPYLISQALAVGSANIQGVSGATYASIAFKSSLESAIAKASAQGTVATPTPSATTATTPAQKPSISRKYHDDDDGGDDGDDDRRDRDDHDDEGDDEWDD